MLLSILLVKCRHPHVTVRINFRITLTTSQAAVHSLALPWIPRHISSASAMTSALVFTLGCARETHWPISD